MQSLWVGMGLAAIAALWVALMAGSRRQGWGTPSQLWWASGLYSACCVAGILGIWREVALHPPRHSQLETITSSDQRDRYLQVQARMLPPDAEHPSWIPTGLYLQSLRFVDATRMEVAGYVWQKYGPDLPPDLSRGFNFPEASETRLTEAYHQSGAVEIKGWYFLATVRVQTEVDDYPFDRQAISLRLRHADFGRNVVLIPDVDAYPSLDPTSLPGLEPGLTLDNWEMEASGFRFGETRYATSFGIPGSLGHHDVPELYFQILLRRNVIASLFALLIVPVFAAILIFLVLMMCTTRSDRNLIFGFSISNVLRSMASLSFVIISSQLNLRNQLHAQGSTYIEAFYLVLYPAILLVVWNAFLCTRSRRAWWIEFEDNLIPKLCFWPLMLGTLLVASVGLLR